MSWDVIVIGLGGMGTAAAAHLAQRGQRVLGLEQHALGHRFGSSHGLTRIIRLAYFEDPSYVPLLRRAFELWRELEVGLDEPLLHITGGLDVGAAGSTVFEGSLRSCREHSLPHSVLSGRELRQRFRGWNDADDLMAVWQPDAGFLAPERCIAQHAARAVAAGADLRTGVRVREIVSRSGRVEVRTDDGVFEAGQVVLTAGAWTGDLLRDLAPSVARVLVPERQVLGWFDIADRAAFAPSAFPVFVLEAPEGTFYGFPEYDVPGFKIGKYHHRHERVHPDSLDRVVHAEDAAALRGATARYFPSANGAMLSSATCMFTNTPDEHFVIDRAPNAPEVLVVSACSGHGFKFASVVGEICGELVTRGGTVHDISLFSLSRFA